MKKSETPCIVCGNTPSDQAHLKSVGSGGTMDEFNLIALCRRHHSEQHQIGFVRFIGKHKHIYSILRSKGWHLVTEFGVTKLKRYCDGK